MVQAKFVRLTIDARNIMVNLDTASRMPPLLKRSPISPRQQFPLPATDVAAVPDWEGQAVCVAASGPSSPAILEQVRGRMRVIVINRTFEVAPWADMLYAADSGFWAVYVGAREFAGVKVAPEPNCKRYCPSIKLVEIKKVQGKRVDKLVFDDLGIIGGGGHSGFQALNIALQTGAWPVYLAGYDYLPKHWHDDHPQVLRNPEAHQLQRWRALIDAEGVAVSDRVFNLSDVSTLNAFKRCTVHQALASLSV